MTQNNDQPRQAFFLGLTTAKRADWTKFVVEPVATRSKKPDSVAAEVAEKKATQEEQAAFWPITATVHSCVILDQNGGEVFSSSSGFNSAVGEVSYNALGFLAEHITYDVDACDIGVSLFGLKIRDRMRILAMDAMRYVATGFPGETLSSSILHLWYHRSFEQAPWADPYDILVPSEHRNNFSWESLCDFLGIKFEFDPLNVDTDPKAQAEIARRLTMASGLYIN